ncbi:hypothetical protein K437DRAFT_257699 [Tilletiaria anomala UBC 951]|uniref:Nicotinamide N-methyltransferase n=1 Tax=Tilletiaria anomala (strain ATCC 24038 / CBS 436.72 / UBC 951) TaxID=1037660 RepID=A0A066VN42_TILAU|nr:uncharacterized protein K437DRAFT_257699 [Tilletiaria anomala UBC 951]KDN42851.1 hypothetical protein K437DRAFT_257699 [Tilletiaria anomala UBC 951]
MPLLASDKEDRQGVDEEDIDVDLFAEPAGFRPPSPPRRTRTFYDPPRDRLPAWRRSARCVPAPLLPQREGSAEQGDEGGASTHTIPLDLVGFSPLWGHHLWNAAPALASYLLLHRRQLLPARACVLELGAASGLPGIVAAKYGGADPRGDDDNVDDVDEDGDTRRAESERHVGHDGAVLPFVVSTDYPDPDLLTCLRDNLEMNGVLLPPRREGEGGVQSNGNAVAEGYIWGADPHSILARIQGIPNIDANTDPARGAGTRKFDLLLLSDLIFNHQAHAALLDTCERCLRHAWSTDDEPADQAGRKDAEHEHEKEEGWGECRPEDFYPPSKDDSDDEFELLPFPSAGTESGAVQPAVLVFYTHHRPHLASKDLAFFARARARGWHCRLVAKRNMGVMFVNDHGEERVRATVWGWCLTRGAASAAAAPRSEA